VLSYKNFLTEKLITFNKKAYPKFGNIVIMAGGAGSGKGFIQKNLLGIEGKTLDVDALKKLAMHTQQFASRVKKETGQDLSDMDLRKPENVSKLHELINIKYRIPQKREAALFKSIALAAPDRKPNIIFDVTLKEFEKIERFGKIADELGYPRENIHLVWVVNDVKVAMKQNAKRSRVVPEDILIATHKGAASTMASVMTSAADIRKYMDGDIWLAFNKVGVDSDLVASDKGGSYLKDAFYVKAKTAGKSVASSSEVTGSVYDKIKEYIPNPEIFDNT
jgi:hypothetical protein